MLSNDAHRLVGLDPDDRLRWLVDFSRHNLDTFTAVQWSTLVREAGAFLAMQQNGIGLRSRVQFLPPLRSANPDLTEDQVRSAHAWLKHGLDSLARDETWHVPLSFACEVKAYKGLLTFRISATSSLHLFKALAYDAFRYAKLKVRLCIRCKQAFVVVYGQRYCSPRCSQMTRTRKWLKRSNI